MRKNILLIGGSSGIGLATAKLLSQNHEVYIASRSSDSLTGLDIHHLPFDVITDDLSTLTYPLNYRDSFIVQGASICARLRG